MSRLSSPFRGMAPGSQGREPLSRFAGSFLLLAGIAVQMLIVGIHGAFAL